MKTTQTPAAQNEKWSQIQVRFFTDFLLRLQVRKENAGSCLSRLRHSRYGATSGVDPSGALKTGLWISSYQ